jgi:hypothetical protein
MAMLCQLICYICMITWVVNLGLMASQSTKVPDPATSHVVAWNNHGSTLYRTPLQSYLLVWAWVSGFGFGIAARTIEDKNWWRTIATRRGDRISLNKSKYFR